MNSCDDSDSDKFYILCEFNNETKIDKTDEQETTPVQVGFAEWIIWDENEESKKPISTLIRNKESVLMKWPSNCDVQSKKIMAKRKLDIRWIKTVGCILAQSNDWVEIVEASKSCLKYGVPFSSREMRKKLVKKNNNIVTNSSSSRKCKSTSNNMKKDIKNITITNKKQRILSTDIIKIAAQKTDEIGELDISSNDESLSTITQNPYENLKGKNKKNGGKIKKKQSTSLTDELEAESDLEDCNSYKWKQDLAITKDVTTILQYTKELKRTVHDLKTEVKDMKAETKNLKIAIKDLRSEIKYFTLKCTSFDNTRKKDSETTSTQIKKIDKIASIKAAEKINMHHSSLEMNTAFTGIPMRSSTPLQSKIEQNTDETNKWNTSEDGSVDNVELSKSIDDFINQKGKENESVVSVAEEKVEFDNVTAKSQILKKIDTNITASTISTMPKKLSTKAAKKILRSQPIFDSKAVFNFESKILTGGEMARCKHTNKVSTLAVDLFTLLFTKEEMALGNLTGKAPHGHKNITHIPKRKLDETKINGIIDYMSNFLKDEFTKDSVESEVKKAIANKLNNFIKCDEAKAIQSKFLQQLKDKE